MKRPGRVEYWCTEGQWYWHFKAGNGRVTWDGAEGYASRRNVLRAVGWFNGLLADPVRVVRIYR